MRRQFVEDRLAMYEKAKKKRVVTNEKRN